MAGLLDSIIGSSSALSLASTASAPVIIAAAVTGGVVVTVAAAVFTYKEFKAYEEKKHRKLLEEINKRHKQFLEKIVIPGYDDIQGFPPIFKFVSKEDASVVQSLHYTDDEVRAMGKNLPYGTDVALAAYRESVVSAILKLKEYYFSREDHTDATAGVVSYLLNMLETKCLSFQGYDYDIAYLTAIGKFITSYASMDKLVDTQHFTRLTPVYSYLLAAKQSLEKHKESLLLEDLVAELRDACAKASSDLIRKLVKLTVAADSTDLADTVALEELGRNLLRREYVRSRVGLKSLFGCSIIFRTDSALPLPDSVFKDWIVGLSQYYLKSLDPTSSLKNNSISGPEGMFGFTSWAKSILDEKDRSAIEPSDVKKLNKALTQIRSVFSQSPNFINTKLDSNSKKQKFLAVTENNEVLERTVVIADFARLIHSTVSLQYLCAHLLKSIKQLGDLYVKDPHHFREIFEVLTHLCSVIQKGVVLNRLNFTKIKEANQYTMRLDKDELFPSEIEATLDVVIKMVESLSDRITKYRKELSKLSKITQATVNYEMLSVANLFSEMYPRPSSRQDSSSQQIDSELSSEGEHGLEGVVLGAAVAKRGMVRHTDPLEESQVDFDNAEEVAETLHTLTAEILSKIAAIQQEQADDNNLAKYHSIYNCLNSMQSKAICLLNETDKGKERSEKANKTSALTYSLCHKVLEFLSLDKEARKDGSMAFVTKIHNEIGDILNNGFIDEHNNSVSKFIYTHVCSLGIFRTDTRRRIAELDEACEQLNLNTVALSS
ncbi:MAG: hypothetical protein ACHP65_07875 [Legionellales bacterium]